MKIYRVKPDSNLVQNVLVANENDIGLIEFDGTSRRNDWKEIKLYVFNPLIAKKNFFLLESTAGALVMDEVAAAGLSFFWSAAGELLPAYLEDGTRMFILNVTEVVNALDQERTAFDYYKNGKRGRILSHVFHRDRFAESSIFKIPETVGTAILTYVGVKAANDEFYTAYTELGLTGLDFEELYFCVG